MSTIDRDFDPKGCSIWLADQHSLTPAGAQQVLQQHCSVAERQRFARLQVPRARRQFLLARALQRGLLAQALKTTPDALDFDTGERGKPVVSQSGVAGLHFNLSHSADMLALAVADREVGVDIEFARRQRRFPELARRHFSEAEAEELIQLEGSARDERFYQLWTLKEAYIKARGLGLALPLGDFEFLGFEQETFDFDAARLGDTQRWRFWQWCLAHKAGDGSGEPAGLEPSAYRLALALVAQEVVPDPVLLRLGSGDLDRVLAGESIQAAQLELSAQCGAAA